MPRFVLSLSLLLTLGLALRADSIVFPPQPLPAGTPVEAFPAPRIEQLQGFFEHLLLSRGMQRVDLIFDGDSITDFWQGRSGGLFQKLYNPHNVVDFAIAGDRTQHVLWRLQHGELDGLHPKLIMLMIGTNNIGHDSPEDIIAGIEKIVATYRVQTPDAHVLLLGVFPRGEKAIDPLRAEVKQINDALAAAHASDAHVTFLNIDDKFLQSDGTSTRDILPDFVHPSVKGYQIWADAIQPMIDKYCPLTPAAANPPRVNTPIPTMSWPFPMQAPAGTPATIFPVPHSDWFLHVADNQRQNAKGPFDFVLDGDSLTDYWRGPGGFAYGKHWRSIKLLNSAMSNDQVPNVAWRALNGGFTGIDPKLIMLAIGADVFPGNPKAYAQGIRTILDAYEKQTHAHIVLIGILPRGAMPADPGRVWAKNVNAIISTYTSDPRVSYVDIGDKFLMPDGTLAKDMFLDPLHPSPKGFETWAEAVQPMVDQYLAPAAK